MLQPSIAVPSAVLAAPQALAPLIGVVVGGAFGIVLRRIVLARLSRAAAATTTYWDDVALDAVRGPVVLWCLLLGARLGLSFSAYDARIVDTLHAVIVALVILSVSWTVGRIVGSAVRAPQLAGARLPSARILSTGAQAAVLVVGGLVALQTIGVSVAPVLTALGVGGLAAGLALQDTLANLFAGFHIVVSRQLRPGDFVQLSSGEQGFVQDIAWRNTTIRQLPNNIVIVPNAKLAQSIAVNYSLPDSEQAVLVQVGVGYDDDLAAVERVTIDVAAGVQRDVPGAVRDFAPFIRYHTFGDSSVGFTVIMRGAQFTDNYLMKHEFVKRLHARYRAEGITIPYPQRTVHVAHADPAPATVTQGAVAE